MQIQSQLKQVYPLIPEKLDEDSIKRWMNEITAAIDKIADDTQEDINNLNRANWPVGSVFISIVSTDPSVLLGFGTWEQVSTGRTLVGFNANDVDFDALESTGGSKTANLAHTHTTPNHQHALHWGDGPIPNTAANSWYQGTDSGGGSNTGSGGSGTQSIMNPYYVVYIWKRVS